MLSIWVTSIGGIVHELVKEEFWGPRNLHLYINDVDWVQTIFRFCAHVTGLRSTTFARFADDSCFRFPFPLNAQKLFFLEPACTPAFPILDHRFAKELVVNTGKQLFSKRY